MAKTNNKQVKMILGPVSFGIGLLDFSFKTFKKPLRGFTLIELLVSVSIIAMISGVFLTNYHSTNKRSELILSVQKLASDIRLAQNYSMGLKDFNDNPPQGGWGVHLSTVAASYSVFGDVDGGKSLSAGEEFKNISYPAGVSVDSISVNGINNNSLDVVFFPPDPVTYINDTGTSTIITLKDQSGSTKQITINFLGLVEVSK